MNPNSPAPGCAEVCAHIVGSCAPGANTDMCRGECETSIAGFAACPHELDAYMRCMVQAHVECKPGEVTVDDCSTERSNLEWCQH